MSLDLPDLPGGAWVLKSQMSWRSGYVVPNWKSDVARRSRGTGGFIVWRSFRQTDSPLTLWAQVGPYATREDADDAVPRLLLMGQRNPRFAGTVADEKVIEDFHIPDVGITHVVDRSATGSSKGPSNSKYVMGSVDHIIFMIAFSAYGDGWPWSDVSLISSLQVNKIRQVLGQGNQ